MRIAKYLVALLFLSTPLFGQEGVLQELSRLQRETGLSLTEYRGDLNVIDFSTRSLKESTPRQDEKRGDGTVSTDGTVAAFELNPSTPSPSLGVAMTNGGETRNYADVISPSGICISHDTSRVATAAVHRPQVGVRLLIVSLNSHAIDDVAKDAYTTSQCWSPNDNELVYRSGTVVRIYDVGKRESRELVKGDSPSWSPDGKWIAFVDGDSYYAIAPDGSNRHLLFKAKHGPHWTLSWSPDGRFLAYRQRGGSLGRPCHWWSICIIKFEGPYQLRVHRLADNADAALLDEGDTPVTPNYQWVLPGRQNQ